MGPRRLRRFGGARNLCMVDREREWGIRRDGCEGGEYVYPFSARVDLGWIDKGC